jgi:alpha-galactosidase
MEKIDQNDKWWKYAGPGGWNDPDMLEVGVGDQLNLTEQKTHFSLWALAKAPLLIGCDIRKLAPEVLEILTAPEVIAINQDPLGVQGHKVWNASFSDAAIDVWAGLLSNKDIAVITLNRASVPATIPVRWEELGLQPGTKCLVRDIWQRKDIGTHRNGFTTSNEPHGVSFLRLSCA